VRDLTAAPATLRLSIFFIAYPVLAGLFGLGLGVASAERGERGASMLRCLALRAAFAQVLCLPFVVFTRALFPGREAAIALVFLYTALFSLLCAVLGRLIERPLLWRPSTSLLKYVVFAGYVVLPLSTVPLVSPLGAVRALIEGATWRQAATAFGVLGGLLVGLSALTLWARRKSHA
jgi:hypothetical protein